MYICTYISVYVHISIYIYLYVFTHAPVYTRTHTCAPSYTHIYQWASGVLHPNVRQHTRRGRRLQEAGCPYADKVTTTHIRDKVTTTQPIQPRPSWRIFRRHMLASHDAVMDVQPATELQFVGGIVRPSRLQEAHQNQIWRRVMMRMGKCWHIFVDTYVFHPCWHLDSRFLCACQVSSLMAWENVSLDQRTFCSVDALAHILFRLPSTYL